MKTALDLSGLKTALNQSGSFPESCLAHDVTSYYDARFCIMTNFPFFFNFSRRLSQPRMIVASAATTAARRASNKALIKKVVGMIVAVAVCVAVIVIVLNVLKTFGDSSDDSQGEANYEGN